MNCRLAIRLLDGRKPEDDPQHGRQGPVAGQDPVVEDEVLQRPPLDGHDHRPVDGIHRGDHPRGAGDEPQRPRRAGPDAHPAPQADASVEPGLAPSGEAGIDGGDEAAYDAYDAYLLKTDAQGLPVWSRTYGTAFFDGFGALRQTDDGGFVLGGLMVGDDWDVFLAKIAPLRTGATVTVAIDIMPGSDVNPINLGSPGTTPVAILGSADFDAGGVDPATVSLAGAPVATTRQAKPLASVEDVDGDGTLDMLVHVVTARMQVTVGDISATLRGMTADGTPFLGSDTITVVKVVTTKGGRKRQPGLPR